MKAYYEYEDGTFWAIRTEGENCFTAQGSKYEDFWPELMLKAGSEEERYWRMPPNAKKITFGSPEAAEQEAAKMAAEKSENAIIRNRKFWRIAVEISAYLLFFTPDKYKTPELCALAVERDGMALKYVPQKMKVHELCKKALYNDPYALEYVNENEKTEEICQNAVKDKGETLKFVPEKFITPKLCLEAVKNDEWALEFVPEKLKTYELCVEAVKEDPGTLKFVPEALKTKELCLRAERTHGSALIPVGCRSEKLIATANKKDEVS